MSNDFPWRDWCWGWSSKTLTIWCKELTHWKRPWCWERLKAGGEGDDRGQNGWMASLTQWTWVRVNSGNWQCKGKPGMLQSKGVAKSWTRWATQLKWTDRKMFLSIGNKSINLGMIRHHVSISLSNDLWKKWYLHFTCNFSLSFENA